MATAIGNVVVMPTGGVTTHNLLGAALVGTVQQLKGAGAFDVIQWSNGQLGNVDDTQISESQITVSGSAPTGFGAAAPAGVIVASGARVGVVGAGGMGIVVGYWVDTATGSTDFGYLVSFLSGTPGLWAAEKAALTSWLPGTT